MAAVLIVEDDHDIRVELAELLSDEGYRVWTASHGQEALEQLSGRGSECGLILLDLMMPIMDGWEFRARQRADPTLCQIPVLVLSGAGYVYQRVETLAPEGVLAKPFGLDELLAAVGRYCAPEGRPTSLLG